MKEGLKVNGNPDNCNGCFFKIQVDRGAFCTKNIQPIQEVEECTSGVLIAKPKTIEEVQRIRREVKANIWVVGK